MRAPIAVTILVLSVAALTQPLVPTAFTTIGKIDKPPQIDGVLDDPCWQNGNSAVISHFVRPDMTAFANADTTAHLCYDDRALFFAVRCDEPEMDEIRAYSTKRDTAVWRDDCIEIFLDTNHDTKTYCHFIVNTLGTIYDKGQAADANWDADIEVSARTAEDYWAFEMAIPLSELDGPPAPGDVWGMNIGRERKAGDGGLSLWSPTYAKFHEPDRFGEVRFADAPPRLTYQFESPPMFGTNQLSISAPAGQEPNIHLLRHWPAGLERTWKLPKPQIAATEKPGNWRATYRIVDGSEKAVIVTAHSDTNLLFRQAIPITISPQPHTAALAEKLLALKNRAHGKTTFAAEMQNALGDAETALHQFIQSNITRDGKMSADEWRKQAQKQANLLTRIGAMAYVLWTKSPWQNLARTEMPPTLQAPTAITMTACCNETEAGDFIITNLSQTPLEGRIKLGDLRLIAPEDAATEQAANLIKNGDFAADTNADGIPDHWRPVQKDGIYALQKLPDGSSAFILAADGDKPVSTNFRQTVPVKPGRQYTLIAELSTTDLPGRAGHVHVINNGWTWSKTISPLAPTSARMRYAQSFTAPRSDLFQVVLRLVSSGGGTIRFHNVRLIEGSSRQAQFSPECITLHRIEFQKLRGGNTVADPMPVMNEARTFAVPPAESRQFWMNLDTAALPPGQYSGGITVTPFDRELPPKSLPLRITVRPVRLPDKMPIAVYNWDYARNERYVQDLARHRNNTFLMSTGCRAGFDETGNLTKPVDWSAYDNMLQVKLRYARDCGGIVLFSYGIIRDFHRKYSSQHDWEFMSEPWKKAFKTWVLEFERHLREDIGMGYDEYAVQLWDEATRKNAEMTVQAGKYMKSFAPKIRTCMDGAQSVAEVKALDPVIDLWIPHQHTLYTSKEKTELRALYQKLMDRGEPVWTYTCSTRMKALHPLDYYRLKEWRVWDLALQGTCFWAYNSWRGDPWNDFDGPIADCGTIYDGPGRPITSRRWEATLQGREDYLYLHMLQKASTHANARTRNAIETFIAQAVEDALSAPRDIDNFTEIRARLGTMLQKHCGADPPKLLRGPDFALRGNQVTCSWHTDRAADGKLYYRVPGDAQWHVLDFEHRRDHVAPIFDLPPLRDCQWYLIWWSEDGATDYTTAGLQKDNWFRTE